MASTNGFRVKDGIVQSYPKEDKLVIPDNVHTLTSIFAYDDFISSVKIPSSVTRIGESAFYDCDDLNDVTIPGSVRTIEKDAFGCCGGLERVVLEEGVVELKESVFEACPLTEITLPKSLRCVGLSSLGDFEIPTDENGMQIMDGILFSVPKSVKGHFMIPDGVRVIGSDVFAGCEALTQITIPQSVVSISDNAFAGCSALKTVALPEGLEYVGIQAFAGCSSLESIVLPEGVALRWEDLDVQNRTLSINKSVARQDGKLVISTPKTPNSIRTVLLPEDTVKLLVEEHERHPANPYLFPSPRTGETWDPDGFRRLHDRIIKEIGAEHVCFHDMRHTFATLSLKSGVDVQILSETLGHFSAGFTLSTYVHSTSGMKQSAADAIGNTIRNAI